MAQMERGGNSSICFFRVHITKKYEKRFRNQTSALFFSRQSILSERRRPDFFKLLTRKSQYLIKKIRNHDV